MKTTNARNASFGPYAVDVRSGELRKNGIKLRMGGQPFRILVMLLANPGEMVTREDLRAELWADTFVDFDHGLNSAVQRLRDCLSDTAEKPLWIETVPRRGYRFIGQVEWLSGAAGPSSRNGEGAALQDDMAPDGGGEVAAAVRLPAQERGRGKAFRSTAIWIVFGAGVLVLLLLVVGAVQSFRAKRSASPAASEGSWIQITDFSDSAVSPALSPDGRILAFIRGADTFYGAGQIYAKLLPGGEPVQLTHDAFIKMSPQFSPDGSTIDYSVFTSSAWNTWVVPVLGGEPRPILPNTEGLTWIDPGHLLFSEVKTGVQMAVVTATDTRDQIRDIYVPPRERGMAHRSALSPDHKWVLLAEMDNGGWLPCRLVPFDGSSAGRPVGPQGAGCTYVAWSPDQSWMYFSSDAGGRFHIWRQRFPDGKTEQVTSGATEEEGVAVAPDGASLITSGGLRESTLWVRDSKGERQISSQGYAEYPRFSRDGKKLYYLLRHSVSGQFFSEELRVADLETDRSERLLPDTLVSGYDVSSDGPEVVFSATDAENRSHLWLASLDSGFPPRQFVSPVSEDEPHWDSAGYIYFRAAEGKLNFLYRMKRDGSERLRLLPDPILDFNGVSPDGRWAVVGQAIGQGLTAHFVASPLAGGAPVVVCAGYCVAEWSPDGRTFSVVMDTMDGTETLVAPVSGAKSLPALPPAGIGTRVDMESIAGAKVVDGAILCGPKPGLSASLHPDVHRNLYRVALQ